MYAKYMKRLLDILLSLTILVVLSPLLLVLCILVRSKLGSPIFFKQERPGLHEKIFTMYKFRTMTDKRDAWPLRRSRARRPSARPRASSPSSRRGPRS